MSESLEKLRAQRELIEKHLNWLDEQIKDAENTAARHNESTQAEYPSEMPARIKGHSPDNINNSDVPTPAGNVHHEIEEQLMAYSGSLDIGRVKAGCLIFFAVISLLFLFLLFGLPYLL